jgi:cytoskeletal protein CcmA (bactofilin family)
MTGDPTVERSTHIVGEIRAETIFVRDEVERNIQTAPGRSYLNPPC